MRKTSIVAGVLVAAACQHTRVPASRAPAGPQPAASGAPAVAPAPAPHAGLKYPAAKRVDQVDDFHGVKVADPYRWLEQMDSPETRAWIDAENALTQQQLAKIAARPALEKRLRELWNYERWGVPSREGSRLAVSRNDGLQNQSVLYTLDDANELRTLFDPNPLSADGTVAMAGRSFSNDGKRLAYGLTSAGSDWQIWKVRDVATAKDTSDELRWVKFSYPSWTHDDAGFYYARYDEPKPGAELSSQNYDQKVFYHRLGEPQLKDALVYARPDHRDWVFENAVSEDGRWLVLTASVGTDPKTSIFVQDLRKKGSKVVELLPGFTAQFSFLGSDGNTLWFRTDDGAPRGRIIAVDARRPERSAWRELVPESADTLVDVGVVADRFIVTWLEDAKSRVTIHQLSGKLERQLALPGVSTVSGFSGKRRHQKTWFASTGFATPAEIWELDVTSGKTKPWRKPKLAFEPSDYVTEQVFFQSRDGVKIPMFITHKRGLKRDGQNPTYLYGYGGFDVSITPSFSVPNLVWLELGGIYAVPNLRGGGEYGEAWHQAGIKLHKQRGFDDFIAAAEYLIEHQYTSTPKLAIGGRSNGGLLVGAALTQRPDLFGAALPGVGVLDMLRFNQFTIGWAWESDYGSPQDPEELQALLAYSPYHRVVAETHYPPTLAYTADHDDRVVPAHSYKFIAALQHAQAGPAPILIRIDTKAGHGSGKPTTKQIEEWTDLWGFLVEHLHVAVGP